MAEFKWYGILNNMYEIQSCFRSVLEMGVESLIEAVRNQQSAAEKVLAVALESIAREAEEVEHAAEVVFREERAYQESLQDVIARLESIQMGLRGSHRAPRE